MALRYLIIFISLSYKYNDQPDLTKKAYEKGCALAKQTNNINASSIGDNLKKMNELIQGKSGKK